MEARVFVAVLARVHYVGGKKPIMESVYGARIHHRTSQIPSSKLLKTRNDQNEKKDCQCHGSCHCCCLENPAARLFMDCVLQGCSSLAIITLKRSGLSPQDWFLYRDDATVHDTISVQNFKRRKGGKMIRYLLYSQDIAPADLFLCPRAKSGLAGMSLSQDSIKTSWDGEIPIKV
jgi:hypothetical protein